MRIILVPKYDNFPYMKIRRILNEFGLHIVPRKLYLSSNYSYNIYRMKKKALGSIGIILLIIVTMNLDLVKYGLTQGYGQFRIIYDAKPVSEYLQNPEFSKQKKEKLKLIEKAKRFAEDSLGIKKTKNYSTLYDDSTKGSLTMWVLTACKAFEFTPYEWKFPIIGTFSYKGYFNKKQAKKEEKELSQEGYDTGIRTAGAWSTLGWFNDPIMGNLLDDSDGYIVETIIHELTHATIYVKNDVAFNENLAVFIGHKGALLFLKNEFGKESKEYIEYLNNWKDRKTFKDYVLETSIKLKQRYANFTPTDDYKKKEEVKNNLLQEFVIGINQLDIKNKKNYSKRFKKKLPNNTFFMSYIRYNASLDQFEKEFNSNFNQNIKDYLDFLKQKYSSL